MKAAAALSILLAFSAGAKDAPTGSERREELLARMQADLAQKMVEFSPWLARLEAQREGYKPGSGFKGAQARRGALLADIESRLKDLIDLGVEFDKLRSPDGMAVVLAYNAALDGKRLGADAGLRKAQQRQVFSDGLWNYVDRVHDRMEADKKAFSAAVEEHRQWKARKKLLGALGAALLLAAALGLALWRWSRA